MYERRAKGAAAGGVAAVQRVAEHSQGGASARLHGASLLARDGALVMQRPKSDDIRFTALSGDLYTSRDQMLLLVLRNDDGSVSGFTLTVGRVRDLPFVRQAATRNGGTP